MTMVEWPKLRTKMYNSGRKLSDGKAVSGKGNLTGVRIDAMSGFFGKALRDNKGDPVTMRRDILGILDHYSSTEEKPRHENCPTGPKSRCSYNHDIATGESTHIPIQNPFSDALYELLSPIFQRLADPAALEGCKMGYTQNPNESLHHVLWAIAPKEQFTSSTENELALCLAVCLFNDGLVHTMKSLHEKLGLDISGPSKQMWEDIDQQRIASAEYRELPERKQRRKSLKRERSHKEDGFKRMEGPTYKSNAFY